MARIALHKRKLDTRRDTLDFRDQMYQPTLVEVPAYRLLADYRRARVPILDQGHEGACTGFGLASVVHYLLLTHKVEPDKTRVSPHMLYDLARRYDEWPGTGDTGSSCRGAMKGWHKHGVCRESLWAGSDAGAVIDDRRAEDAGRRPLGAYLRVNHVSLVAMHSAITEAGVLYASARVHEGWDMVGANGLVAQSDHIAGGHAFAIVAYDQDGFWIQNSWGAAWGKQGFGHVGYDDWLANGTDAWVARLGVAVRLRVPQGRDAPRTYVGAVRAKTWSYAELRPHVISIGNDGLLCPQGDIGTTPEMVAEIVRNDIPRITASWKKKRIVLYAHGGLVSQDDALQRVAEYRKSMLESECYPLAFIWHTDFWSTLKDILDDASARRRPEGMIDSAKDFLLDRLDDMLEPVARFAGGRRVWAEMKKNALAASKEEGGAHLVAEEIAALAHADASVEIHVVAHSAGSIFHAPLLQLLAALGIPVRTCTLWAPAATVELFREAYVPLITAGAIGRFTLFQLDDHTEQEDNCARIYNKSLLYLVSNAFEEHAHNPLTGADGEPIIGMAKFVDAAPDLRKLFDPSTGVAERVLAPTHGLPEGDPNASMAAHHADFDDDRATVLATLSRILGNRKATASASGSLRIKSGTSSRREMRHRVDGVVDLAATR